MRQFDPIVTHIMDRFSAEFARLIFNEPNLEILQRLDTKQATIKVHQNDMTFKVRRSNGEVSLLHIEVQTRDSTDSSFHKATLCVALWIRNPKKLIFLIKCVNI